MRYDVTLRGTTPIIMHNGTAGLDTGSAANLEKAAIARKKGSNRTAADEARIRELECLVSLWLDDASRPTIPPSALRSMIETGARKLKQGPQVREGLWVTGVAEFRYDKERYGTTPEELCQKTQYVAAVVVQRSRLLRTRARFELPWSVTFTVDVNDELVDRDQLRDWLDIGGTRIGLGDWRPEKSGYHGRFEVESIMPLD